MAKKLPEPGYYKSNGKTVIVLDTSKLSDTGNVLTKDGDDARWQPAVIFRGIEPGSDLRVLSAAVFDGRFKETTKEDAIREIQDGEAEESKRLAALDGDEAEIPADATASAEIPATTAS